MMPSILNPPAQVFLRKPWIRLADVNANLDNEFAIGGWLSRIK